MTKLFHGSTSDFDKFKISEEFLRTRKEDLKEGMGIYFSPNENFVRSYGNFIYSVDIDEKDCWDFTQLKTLENIIKELSETVDFELESYIPEITKAGVIDGRYSVVNFSREINLLLDSQESFYINYQDDPEELFEKIKDVYREILTRKSFIKYYDREFASVIYLCKAKEDKLKITEKRKFE